MIENSQPEGGYVLSFGGKRIPFRIEYRKRKKLAITVHPEPRLEVLAPEGVASDQVLARIERRAAWILKQWRYFEQFLPKHPGPRYVSGETHLYLGRQYRLKVHEIVARLSESRSSRTGMPTAETSRLGESYDGGLNSPARLGESCDKTECAKLVGRFLHVWSTDRSNVARIEQLLDNWYREHAERVFRHRLRLCLEQCPSLKLPHEPRLTIRRMSHRWGSCTKAGNVLLNLDLVKVPTHCIDYVLVHELCHLQIHNHSPAFYRLLSRCMPDWERRKRRLEGYMT